jgi:hypothetical protein
MGNNATIMLNEFHTGKKLFPLHEMTVEVLSEKHIEGVAQIITTAFCKYEPMSQHLHISREEFLNFIRHGLSNCLQDKISCVILHKEKVVACSIAIDLCTKFITDESVMTEKLAHIFNFLGVLALPENIFQELNNQYDTDLDDLEKLERDYHIAEIICCRKLIDPTLSKKISHGEIAHGFMSAVHEDYMGVDLSFKVNLAGSVLCASRHYHLAVGEITSTDRNKKNNVGFIRIFARILYKMLNFDPQQCLDDDFDKKILEPFAGLKGCAEAYLTKTMPTREYCAKLLENLPMDVQQVALRDLNDFADNPLHLFELLKIIPDGIEAQVSRLLSTSVNKPMELKTVFYTDN